MNLETKLSQLNGVGPSLEKKLLSLKLENVSDLINFLPRKYFDFSNTTSISKLKPGTISLKANIESVKSKYVRRGLNITEATVSDSSGTAVVVWFNQPYLERTLKINQQIFLVGEFDWYGSRLQITNPLWELSDSKILESYHGILPIYKETKGLSSVRIRKLISSVKDVFDEEKDIIPKQYEALSKSESLRILHFPKSTKEIEKARNALATEELFCYLLSGELTKRQIKGFKARKIEFSKYKADKFIEKIPFKLTDAQKRVSWEIILDLQKSTPANRLVQGDVGSGKTLIGAFVADQVVNSGFQVALLAPTETLASQHFQSFKDIFSDSKFEIELLSRSSINKPEIKRRIENSEVDIVIGTHAIIQKSVKFSKLALAIIDEQHRFGVEQRKYLQKQGRYFPHLVSMSATPIPRSLALTVFGDMDVSIVDQMPPNRLPIVTKLVRQSDKLKIYSQIEEQLKAGGLIYIVCPLIDHSEKSDKKNVTDTIEQISKSSIGKFGISGLHGRMTSEEKNQTITDFKNKKFQILVSTTVIEVGVDVKDATMMMILGAEGFGLAQLHQLRGRVGRSDKQSYCYIVPSLDQFIGTRLKFFAGTNDGFKLAEFDLKTRGAGQVYGISQHGQLDLKFAKLDNLTQIQLTRKQVREFLDLDVAQKNSEKYPELYAKAQSLRALTRLN